MQELAPGVRLLSGLPFHAINIYLVEDVLIDAGIRWQGHHLLAGLQQVRDRLLPHGEPLALQVGEPLVELLPVDRVGRLEPFPEERHRLPRRKVMATRCALTCGRATRR